jgi:HAD superfamily hydrolase (TIGR01549 family)
MEHIQAIFFDFGGTLDSDGVDWFTRIYRRIRNRCDGLDPDWFQRLADRAAEDISLQEDTAQLSMDQTVQRFCEQVRYLLRQTNGRLYGSWEPAAVTADFMAEAKLYLERNRSVLEQLHSQYRLGVISNNWGNTTGWCEQFQYHEFLEVTIDSTVVGLTKPDPAIFQAARERFALPPETCAYVGDWFESDIVGAHRAGMTTVWLRGAEKNCPDVSIVDYEIEKLTDLLGI